MNVRGEFLRAKCAQEGCETMVQGRDLCYRHNLKSRQCLIDGCGNRLHARGLCSKHYRKSQVGHRQRSMRSKPLMDYLDKEFPDADVTTLALVAGASPRQIQRWRTGKTGISFRTADAVAIHLGSHPLLIWGEDYWDV